MLNFHSFQNIHLVGLSSVEGAIMAAFLLQKGFSLTAHDFGSTHTLFSRFQENHVALTQANNSNSGACYNTPA
jgi:hypothetical protein